MSTRKPTRKAEASRSPGGSSAPVQLDGFDRSFDRTDGLGTLDDELWLVEKLREKDSTLRYALFDGLLDESDRKRIVREAIIARGLEAVITGRRYAGRPCETFSQSFERTYREPLVPKPPKR